LGPVTEAPARRPLRFRDLDEVAAALRADGNRLTTPRKLVLQALFAADGLVSAEHIASGADTGVALDLTSVYRNLERLEELGVVRHVHVGHGAAVYGLVGEGEHEYLVCDGCGKVTPAALDEVRALVKARFGYEVRFTHFPIHGRCADCA
jgi:Fur family ferric uptake transcriptional regulator